MFQKCGGAESAFFAKVMRISDCFYRDAAHEHCSNQIISLVIRNYLKSEENSFCFESCQRICKRSGRFQTNSLCLLHIFLCGLVCFRTGRKIPLREKSCSLFFMLLGSEIVVWESFMYSAKGVNAKFPALPISVEFLIGGNVPTAHFIASALYLWN